MPKRMPTQIVKRVPRAALKADPDAAEMEFDFESADFSVPIPEKLPPAPKANALPFRAWYAKHAAAALEGKQPHLFVPHAYWTLKRDVLAEKATDGYAKGKARDQFNKWQKADDAPKDADKLQLVILGRTGKEGIEGIDVPGISMWITKT